MTENAITRRYKEVGLPITLPHNQREAWQSYQAGNAAPLSLLPTNGDTCPAASMGGSYCGFPLLINGVCPNRSNHRDVIEAEAALSDDPEGVDPS